jgi:two-component system, cell cycle sensor histidine kinase and response regulator CckA
MLDDAPITDPRVDPSMFETGPPAAARLAAIVASADDGIVSKTLDGTILTWNTGAERIFGYTAAEMVGHSVYRLIPPELHHEEQIILARIGKGEHVAHYETTRMRKNGTRVEIALTVSPVRDATGTIIGASSIKRDITERRQATETLARLAAIVESSDDVILTKSLDGTVTSWNASGQRIFGFSPDEIVGRSINLLVPERLQDEERSILARVAEGEHVAHYETMRRRKNGSELHVSLTISPLRNAHGEVTGASSIMRDVTEQRRTEAAIRQMAKLEAIGRLAGGLAHDFNNQLYAVAGFANFVGKDPGLGAAARQDLLQIQKAAERMASLTRQLLAFARQQVLKPETLDLDQALTELHPMLQRLVGSNIGIQLALSNGAKWITVDRDQLAQVIMNLVINARDAMRQGGDVLVRTMTLEVGPGQQVDRLGLPVDAGAYAELAVIDAGEGIPAEHLPHIFDPFYTTKEAGEGTGLGLATVEGIVSQSGGHIQVASAGNRGTTLRLRFPLAPEPPTTAGQTITPAERASLGRLLVVDDEPLVRQVVARTLQDAGYDVIEAKDGKAALRCFDEVGGAIDLVVTDVIMPGLGGRELVGELKRRKPDVAVLWVSGHPRDVGLPQSDTTDQIFLQKPVRPEDLITAVQQALQEHNR